MDVKDWISTVIFRILELAFVVGFFIVLYAVISKSIPPENKDLVNILLGVLATVIVSIGNYEWGSSRSSDKKTDAIVQSSKPLGVQLAEAHVEEIKAGNGIIKPLV